MRALLILNDAPYGSERTYDGLRLAGALGRSPDHQVRVFLLGDAAGCVKAGQKVPEGFYNIQLMRDRVVRHKGEIGACGTCMDARDIGAGELSAGVHRSTMDELVQWTAWADKVLVL
ncbi:MAG TPA: DsrE family protein [Burkholderiales bacterium]|nr:DsrE family protein [Burkholderiales bacterium]